MVEIKKWVGYGDKRKLETVSRSNRLLKVPLQAEKIIADFVFGELDRDIKFGDNVLSTAKKGMQ